MDAVSVEDKEAFEDLVRGRLESFLSLRCFGCDNPSNKNMKCSQRYRTKTSPTKRLCLNTPESENTATTDVELSIELCVSCKTVAKLDGIGKTFERLLSSGNGSCSSTSFLG